jgi:hypothetical protein
LGAANDYPLAEPGTVEFEMIATSEREFYWTGYGVE